MLRKALCFKAFLLILSSKEAFERDEPDVKRSYKFLCVFSSRVLECIERQPVKSREKATKRAFSFVTPDVGEMTSKYLMYYIAKHSFRNVSKSRLCHIREMPEWKVLKYMKRRGLGAPLAKGRRFNLAEGFEGRLVTTLRNSSPDNLDEEEEGRRWQEASWEFYRTRGGGGTNTVLPV